LVLVFRLDDSRLECPADKLSAALANGLGNVIQNNQIAFPVDKQLDSRSVFEFYACVENFGRWNVPGCRNGVGCPYAMLFVDANRTALSGLTVDFYWHGVILS
jgi:hypothetical protein